MKKGERKPYPNADWERARVRAWLAIIQVHPMYQHQSTHRRYEEFKERIQKLEADVPTPVDA